MAGFCVLPDNKEYQTLATRSGIPYTDENFRKYIEYFNYKYGRFPNLDEIPGADSKNYLNKKLEIKGKQTKYTSIKKLLDFTLEKDPIDIQQKLNSIFRDKEIELIPTDDEVIINITDRPSKYNIKEDLDLNIDNPDSTTFFVDGLYKMANQYGIKFKMTNDKEINEKFIDLDVLDTKAFIYQGDIYINIDQADVNSPIHEMLHLLIGSMRFTNPNVYLKLLLNVYLSSELEFFSKLYPGRTQNDLLEEKLITEISDFITSKKSNIKKEYLYDVFYEIRRNLDTLLMGLRSVGNISINDIFDMSFTDLGKLVQSLRLVNNFTGLISNAYAHRLLGNIKSKLMKTNDLKLNCI